MKYDIINTTNKENHFLVDANHNTDEPDPMDDYYFEYELIVLSTGCNQIGPWGSFCLKDVSKDSTSYMIPKNYCRINQLHTYT